MPMAVKRDQERKVLGDEAIYRESVFVHFLDLWPLVLWEAVKGLIVRSNVVGKHEYD